MSYSNDADGTCQACGEETDEEWHAFCSSCYREEQGWDRPGPAGPNIAARDTRPNAADRTELDRQADYRRGWRDGWNAALARYGVTP